MTVFFFTFPLLRPYVFFFSRPLITVVFFSRSTVVVAIVGCLRVLNHVNYSGISNSRSHNVFQFFFLARFITQYVHNEKKTKKKKKTKQNHFQSKHLQTRPTRSSYVFYDLYEFCNCVTK